jgi:uncharacterized membrane protein YidH (DUF202 family)
VNPEQDVGLAAERTSLAWRRSGVSMIAIGLGVARGIPTIDTVPGRPLLGLVIVVLGAAAFTVSHVQATRRGARVGTDRPTAELADLWPVSAATLLAALGAAVVVLLS